MTKLSACDIEQRLALAKGWEHHGDMLIKTWQFSSCHRALEFLNQVAQVCEQTDHFPDVTLRYRSVRVELSTHDAGGLTARDFELAAVINALPVDR